MSSELPEAINGFDFDQWLTEARIAQTSVDIMQRPDYLAEAEDWQRRMDQAKKMGSTERGLGDPNPLAELEQEGAELLERIRSARSVWYLAAVSDAENEAIEAALPFPDAPVQFDREPPLLAAHATEVQAQAFLAGWDAWNAAKAQFMELNADKLEPWSDKMVEIMTLRQAERLCRAIVSIKQGGKVNKVRLTRAQIEQLPERIGKPQFDKLVAALDKVSTALPEVNSAFLSRT